MKKKLESELVSIAHRILKLKGKEDVIKMHAEVATLYEKLSVLKFAHENFEGALPTIGTSSIVEMMDKTNSKKVSETIEVEDETLINEAAVEEEKIIAPVLELIKDKIEPQPNKQLDIETVLEEALPKPKYQKNDLEDLMSGYIDMPIFDPVPKTQVIVSNEKKSLNDTVKKGGFNIGLNDKLAFIKHLFEGKNEDYERVISQLNSFDSFTNAKQFLVEIVKPDYNNWVNKEEVEERFFQILESRFS